LCEKRKIIYDLVTDKNIEVFVDVLKSLNKAGNLVDFDFTSFYIDLIHSPETTIEIIPRGGAKIEYFSDQYLPKFLKYFQSAFSLDLSLIKLKSVTSIGYGLMLPKLLSINLSK
jgi:hypothetical protein